MLQPQTAGGSASDDALDVGPGLRARNPADMHAFLNLAAFLDGVLPAAGSALFEPWVRSGAYVPLKSLCMDGVAQPAVYSETVSPCARCLPAPRSSWH